MREHLPRTPTEDPFDLVRFLDAQMRVYPQVVSELCVGQKRSHWMWFIFPQFLGLGTSGISCRYAIKSLDEARDYLQHAILGSRVIECTRIVNSLHGLSARQIFGTPDDLKFHSSMTLFEVTSGPKSPFSLAITKYFAGRRDLKTVELIGLAKQS